SEPPSVSSSARLGSIRVVWMCSGFCPRRFFSLSLSLIQSSRSATESQPTHSLMRWSGILETAQRIQTEPRAIAGREPSRKPRQNLVPTMPWRLTRPHSSVTVREQISATSGGTMRKIALLVALAVVAAAPTIAVAKTKKAAKPAPQVQTDPQKMTFDQAMEYNKQHLSLIPQGLPLV